MGRDLVILIAIIWRHRSNVVNLKETIGDNKTFSLSRLHDIWSTNFNVVAPETLTLGQFARVNVKRKASAMYIEVNATISDENALPGRGAYRAISTTAAADTHVQAAATFVEDFIARRPNFVAAAVSTAPSSSSSSSGRVSAGQP